MPVALNKDIAGRLDEVASILAEQGANRFRVQAYHQAAVGLRGRGDECEEQQRMNESVVVPVQPLVCRH